MSIINKTVLFLGPSSVALDGFDYSVIHNYDYIARTNFFLDRDDIDQDKNKCDILFLNYLSAEYYCLEKIDSNLFNKKIFTKTNRHRLILSQKYKQSKFESIETTISEIKRNTTIQVPYLGTSAIFHLIKNYKEVAIAGIDFYQSGFGLSAKYIEQYKAYCNSNMEQDKHAMKKDMLFLAKLYLLNKDRMRFLYKSRDILHEFMNKNQKLLIS